MSTTDQSEQPAYRVQFMDPDYRVKKYPLTNFYCIKCEKDIDPNANHRYVYCELDQYHSAVHPEDVHLVTRHVDRMPIGSDCAKRIGLEWSEPKDAPDRTAGRSKYLDK